MARFLVKQRIESVQYMKNFFVYHLFKYCRLFHDAAMNEIKDGRSLNILCMPFCHLQNNIYTICVTSALPLIFA
jgi:hypothetical protein